MKKTAVSPAMQEVLDQYGEFHAPPLESLTPENARNLPTMTDAVQAVIGKHIAKRAFPFPEPVAEVEHRSIPGESGELLARIYRPEPRQLADNGEAAPELPVLLYFHGGGWVIANLDTYDSSCRALCNEAGFIVVSVAYRQAPEHKFPAALDDAFAAYRWLTRNAPQIGGDRQRIAVAGESAGGNLAAVVCLRARDEGVRLPIHQLLVYPVTDLTCSGLSHQEHADAKPLNEAMMVWFRKQYLKSEAEAKHEYASPLWAHSLAGLPPATVITAQFDPLCSDGELYAEKLRQAGVSVTARRFEGVAHEFFGMKALLPEAKDAIALAARELRSTLDELSGGAPGIRFALDRPGAIGDLTGAGLVGMHPIT